MLANVYNEHISRQYRHNGEYCRVQCNTIQGDKIMDKTIKYVLSIASTLLQGIEHKTLADVQECVGKAMSALKVTLSADFTADVQAELCRRYCIRHQQTHLML